MTSSAVQLSRIKSRLRTSTARDLGGTIVFQLGLVALGVITGVLSARILGPQGRGELAAAVIWPSTLISLFTLGVNQAVVYQRGKRIFSLSETWTAAVVIGICQSLAVIATGYFVLPHLLSRYSPAVLKAAMLMTLAAPAIMIGGYPASLFQGSNDLRRFNKLRILAPGIYAAGLFTLVLLRSSNLIYVMGAQVAGFALAAIAAVLVLRKETRPRFELRPDACKGILAYGARVHLSTVAAYLNQRMDQLLLSLLLPARELGLYAVAVTLAVGIGFVPTAVGNVTLANGANQSAEAARRTIARSFRITLLWLLVAGLSLFVLSPFLISLLFGDKFSGSILACRILVPGIIAAGLNQVLYSGANALGNPVLPSIAEGVGLLATGLGLYLLVPAWGYVGAAAVSTAAYTISLVVMLAACKLRLDISFLQLLGLARD